MSVASSEDLIDLTTETNVRLPTQTLVAEAHALQKLQDALLLAPTKDAALEIALSAAELSMRALKLAKDPATRKSMSTKVKSLLEQAEQIKRDDCWQPKPKSTVVKPFHVEFPNASAIKKLEEPVSLRQQSTAEKILLMKASQLNGFKFPPWQRPPADTEFNLGPGETLFHDAPELRLSSEQMEVFDGWKPAEDALPPPAWFPEGREGLGPTMSTGETVDLVQDAATDCSVVASLCAGIARTERGHTRILREVIYPWDHTHARPRISPNGKYIMRLNFNGAYRRVEIDDKIPVSKSSRVLHVLDRNNPSLLWPALIEKAYLKVRGGYDFPGSNSGTDLWILSGWIPEQIFLQDDSTRPSDLWNKIYKAHKYGDVLITMGTGKMSSHSERENGLAGEHDYAVLDLREVDGQRLLLVKNPWCEGTSWRGSMPRRDGSPDESEESDQETASEDDQAATASSRDLLNANHELSPGTFWMDLDSVMQHFESIYLNWNPGLFTHRQDLHFSWDLAAKHEGVVPQGVSMSFVDHPQFNISTTKGGTIWLLLCRHFQDAPAPNIGSVYGSQRNEVQITGFISLYVFDAKGDRVNLSDGSCARGPFVDSPQTLLRLDDLQSDCQYTVVPTEQDLSAASHTFTLSAFSNSPITLGHAATRYACRSLVTGSWTAQTAGGNANSAQYCRNPQFSIAISDPTPVMLLLSSTTSNLNLHVKLVHGRGQRIQTLRSRDIVFDSKDYRRGCALAECAALDAGVYTIICSTFEAGQTGAFSLRVDSATPVQLALLPREGAGRIKTALSKATFRRDQQKIAAPIGLRRLTKISVLVKHAAMHPHAQTATVPLPQHQQPRSMIRVTLELGTGPQRRILIASSDGEYSDAPTGVRTEEIDISPAMTKQLNMWLVIERMFTPSHAQEEVFGADILCDAPDAVVVGVWRQWDD